jgi:hypothetical protein
MNKLELLIAVATNLRCGISLWCLRVPGSAAVHFLVDGLRSRGGVRYHACGERPSNDVTCGVLFAKSPVLGHCLSLLLALLRLPQGAASFPNGSGASLVDDEVLRVVGTMHRLVDGFLCGISE